MTTTTKMEYSLQGLGIPQRIVHSAEKKEQVERAKPSWLKEPIWEYNKTRFILKAY